MKKLELVIFGALVFLLAAGCKETPKYGHPAGDQPANEHPAQEQPPKDHPAH
ncbi:MAG: hypothetical protein WC299_14605 [Kiritimatiellia bacterium]